MSHLARLPLAALLTLAVVPPLSAQDTAPLRTFRKIQLSDKFFAEGATFGDLNRDGQADLIAGPFWFEGPDYQKQHIYYPPKPFDPLGYSDNFFAFVHDFNGDGWNDILIYGFPGKDASWFENPQGKDGMWVRHLVLEVVDNESPTWTDLTGDGKPEIVCSSGGHWGYATPNWDKPEEPWTFHKISENVGVQRFTHGLGVGDVNGDGRMDLLEMSGWWEQPASLDGDPVWKKHPVKFSPSGGAQMYAYDVDGDGLNDVITSLQAHGYGLVWYRQTLEDGIRKFTPNTILGATTADNPYGVVISQLHAIDLVDMNGDGLKDIVTGKRFWAHGPKGDAEPNAPAVVYWFELKRTPEGVDWVPHLIDDDSGVGTQVVAGDFTGDGRPDVVVGNKKGIFAHIQEVKEVARAEWEHHQPRKRIAMAEGLSPEEAARAMTLPAGFHARLQAGEPDVVQPIAMAYDERGRLWVAEAYSYPVRLPEDEARDRILIFEDTTGDGRFDRRTVFTDKLNLVSGIAVGFGGVWVGAAPHLLFIPDANGDDRPDGPPQVLLDGWGYQDTHETLNSFIWGPDGWLYGCHGVFTHSNVGKPGAPDSQRTRINAGIWRYHPTRHEFEVFAEGTSNPWGVDFNDRGHAFATACVIPHLYHVIQGARYQRQAGQHFNSHTYADIQTIARHRHWVGNQWNNDDRAKSDSLGGGHAHAGAMIYLGGVWPERYRNQLFMNNIHGARLNQDQLAAQGSGYVGDAAPDFCFANDAWSQWISLTYGPDGQVTMIDWYDKNQCHHNNTAGHDRTNGRIFKIVYGDHQAVQVDLGKLSDLELVNLQTHANQWHVRHARRVLQERAAAGQSLSEAARARLYAIFHEPAQPAHQLHVLWTAHVTGVLNDDLYLRLLAHDSPDVRAWAIQLMTERRSVSPEALTRLASLAKDDPSPVVRLYVSSAMQRLPVEQRWEMAAGLLSRAEDADDHNLPLVTWYGVEPLVMTDLPRALQLAQTSKIPTVSRFIVRRAAAEERGYGPLLSAITAAEPATQAWMLAEVVAALKVRANLPMPAEWTTAYEKLMASNDATLRQQAEFIAVKFGDQRVFPKLRETLTNRQTAEEARKLALDSLVVGKDAALPSLLHKLLDDPALSTAAINALAAFDHPETPAVLAQRYAELSPENRQAAIATLTSRAPYVLALMDSIEQQQIPRNDLTAFTVRQLTRFEDPRVLERVNAVWGSLRATPGDRAAEMEAYRRQLRPNVLKVADLRHGRAVYNKTCASCHVLFGAGKPIGPELTGSNRRNLDYLLENMLDPSAVVGKDYQMTLVVTDAGRSLTGIVKQENDTAITLQTPTELVTIPKGEIEVRKLTDVSLMPEGQLKTLKPEEVRDLVAYLQTSAQVPLPDAGPWLDPATGRIANAIEGESLRPAARPPGASQARSQPMGAFKLSKWSGDAQLWWTGAKPGDKLALDIPVEKAGRYEVYVGLTKAIDYGIVRLAWDDQSPTEPLDLFNDGVINMPISLGVRDITAGRHRLTIEIVGANPQAVKGYMFGLDYVALEPAREAPLVSGGE
jgi:putative membrane-bound dehydrogenase-like protein